MVGELTLTSSWLSQVTTGIGVGYAGAVGSKPVDRIVGPLTSSHSDAWKNEVEVVPASQDPEKTSRRCDRCDITGCPGSLTSRYGPEIVRRSSLPV